jgi:ligand-binding SRPBCC domain-containing protein
MYEQPRTRVLARSTQTNPVRYKESTELGPVQSSIFRTASVRIPNIGAADRNPIGKTPSNPFTSAGLQGGMRHHFETQQWLPFPVATVFAFFANPRNLPPLMPAWQRARIEELRLIAPPPPPPGSPARLGTGMGTTLILSFRLLPFLPLRMNWHALIPEFAWNERFCDEQTSGPFHYWRHCHSVAPETRDGVAGALLCDRVEYELPGGPLGDLLNSLIGRAQFRYLFGVRHQATERLMPLFADSLRRQTLP